MAAPRQPAFELSPERRMLLRALLERENLVAPVAPQATPPAGDESEPAPLSFAQERLWFLDQFQPGMPVYNMPFALRLEPPVDEAALRAALDELVRRHACLRTTFATRAARPVQVVAPAGRFALERVDLSDVPLAGRGEALATLFRAETAHVFDLARGPLVHGRLVRLGEDQQVLLLNMHHIVSDGWSLDILMREIPALYEALRAGRPSPLAPLPTRYVDYAREQRRALRGAELERLLGYWRRQLDGAPPLLELPADHARPPEQSFRGETLLFRVPRELSEELAALGRRAGATLFMTLLAAFKTLLLRYTRRQDIVVGTPIAGRDRTALEGLVGFFVNTLVLRTDLSGDPPFTELLRRVREVTLGAYAHQGMPFEKLVEELRPERNLNHNPLFQVLFALQNTPGARDTRNPAEHAASGEAPVVVPSAAKFDLSLFMAQTDDGLAGELEYCLDLFERDSARRLLACFLTLLRGVAARPERRLSELPLLDERTRRLVLVEWNASDTPGAPPACVHELFEAAARRAPQRPAAECGAQSLTYAALDAAANRLARSLRARGVGPEARVGLCLERSLDALVAVLGVLKAGAAYVPLDPGYPRERLRFMLADAGIGVLLTHTSLLGLFTGERVEALALDALQDALAREADEPPPRAVEPGNAAYVIYTSGSTGRPKGVVMTHAALCNLVRWHAAGARAWGPARTLQFASLSFDVSFQELFATWCTLGTLVLTDEATRRDPEALLRLLSLARIERLFLPPVALQQLAEAAQGASEPLVLREVIAAGEQLKVTPAVAAFHARLPGGVLRNHYGPTETHVVSELVLDGSPTAWPAFPSIGRPIDNARLYVLDEALQPLPPGVPGELYIGGAGVARGYLARPELTAARFVPDPFARAPGARLYRTGDLVRHAADGALEFLGRLDHQIKLRGYRIEAGEVEVALVQHEALREAAVLVWGAGTPEAQLCAYVVPRPGQELEAAALRAFLRERLPEYMLPAAFVPLAAMPLSPNGKLDRARLPDPRSRRLASAGSGGAPRNRLEEHVARVWREVLRVEAFGVHDSFFDLGGHSLVATQVVSRLRDLFGVSVPLRRLFEQPSSVADLALAIVQRLAEERPDEAERALGDAQALSDAEVRARLRAPAATSS